MSYAARGVSVRIGRATLLDDVSVAVAPGELVVVAGPNGAGKSTLIGVLAGDRHPGQGRVQLDGRALAEWPVSELARRRAVMGTEREVAFAFSAQEVALLGRLPLHGGDPAPADRSVVARLLEAVDCSSLASRVFGTLSTGERQRVQLARALAQVTGPEAEPDRSEAGRFVLLDEPTSSLDPAHQHLAMRLLRTHADRGLGVLAVLHDLNLASAYADSIVLLSHGRVAAAGSPAEVLRPEVLEPVFGIPMLVLSHPRLPRPVVIAEPITDPASAGDPARGGDPASAGDPARGGDPASAGDPASGSAAP